MIATPGFDVMVDEQSRKAFVDIIPIGRIGKIAKSAVFLASDDSSFIAGNELFVDGGTAQI
jgi:NAD(P)-dependent dehydrogenase (short-subunit alcohol dehydrogenase family)